MDTVIRHGQAMALHMAVDMGGVEVSAGALGQDMAGAEDITETSDGKALILLLEHGMDQPTMPLMEVLTP